MGQIFQMNSCNLAEYNKIVTPQEEIGIFFHYHLTTKYCKQIQEISESWYFFFKQIKYNLYVSLICMVFILK